MRTLPNDGYADGGEPYTDDELEIINADDIDYADCPVCDGIGALLGQLGKLSWYRCIDCGIDFNQRKGE